MISVRFIVGIGVKFCLYCFDGYGVILDMLALFIFLVWLEYFRFRIVGVSGFKCLEVLGDWEEGVVWIGGF